MINVNLSPEVEKLSQETNGVLDQAKKIQIISLDQFQTVGGELIRIKGIRKQVEDLFEDPISQAHKAHKALLDAKKKLTDPLDQAEAMMKRSMTVYEAEQRQRAYEEQECLRREAEDKARKEREALLAKAERAMDSGKDQKAEELIEKAENVQVFVPVVVAQQPKVQGVSFREIWTYEVIDINLVPREYLMLDEKRLAAQARATRDSIKVPGIRFYAEKNVSASRG